MPRDINRVEPLIPYGRKWTRGVKRDTETHHALVPVRDQVDHLTSEQFVWTPHDDILHTLPPCCTTGELMWRTRVPMLCLEVIEWHPANRVMRELGVSQHIPEAPLWLADHTRHDGRSTVDQDFISEHMHCVGLWIHWQPRFVAEHDNANLDAYMRWYLQHDRLLLGNRTLSDSRYVAIALAYEAMRRGLHQMYDKVLLWMERLETRVEGIEMANDIRRICDQANQGLQGTIVPDEQYQQPLEMHGRGGEGHGLGRSRGRGRGDATVRRGVRDRGRGRRHVLIHERVGDPVDDPVGHYEPEPQAVADDPPFHPSPSMPGCSSMPEPHNFSTYVAPAWVEEPNRQSYCDMPSRNLTCTLRLSFGLPEFGDMAISARKNNHKSNHCVDPVAAMNKRWRRCCEWGAQAASVDTT
ncbi:hypothetical protein FXO38_09278, partial [Capsicum annuum]